MAWNPSLHPRGPNGRFTQSFARLAGSAEKKRIGAARSKFKARPPFRSPGDAHGFLSGFSTNKTRGPGQMDRMLAQLRAANQSLRTGKPDQSGFEQLLKPTPQDVTVFRSVPSNKFGHVTPQDLKGFVVSDAGYFPTSLAPTKPAPGEVRMRIDVPKGTKAAASPDTSELVLDAGLEMSVDEVTEHPDGSADMHLTALPATSPVGGSANADTPSDPRTEFDRRIVGAAEGAPGRQAAPLSYVNPAGPPPLSQEQRMGLGAYLSEDYQAINHILRGGSDDTIPRGDTTRDDVDFWIEHIDDAMGASPLAEDVVAFRGIGGAERIFGRDRLMGDLTGMEWREDAYVSTSTDQAVSEDFAGNLPPGAVMMRVLIPRGIGGIELSDESYESELMLQRGLTMRVVSDNGVDEDGVRRIDVEVVPIDAT